MLSGGGVFKEFRKIADVKGGEGEVKRVLLPAAGFLEFEVTGRNNAAIITLFSSHPLEKSGIVL